jgi:hypothetical protein
MKPEAQRIAIAEACHSVFTKGTDGEWYFNSPYEGLVIFDLNDLNAMHEAEKMLRKPMKGSDTDMIIGDRMHKYAELIGYAFDATAAKRAEAFLRTIGKWATTLNKL